MPPRRSMRCSRSMPPNVRPRSRCSICSVSRGRRSPRPPRSRSTRRTARRPCSPALARRRRFSKSRTHHAAKRRRRGRRMVAVVVGIAAAGALAFVGATIANADRVVDVPRVTGMTVPQARVATAAAAHVDVGRGTPRRRWARIYSESVADGTDRLADAAAGRAGRAGIVRSRRPRQSRHGVRRGAGHRGG